MSKRKQRKEEERRILAEFDQAVAAKTEASVEKTDEVGNGEVYHCKRCKTKLEGGVCPTCGFTLYQPMKEEKRKKIRNIVTICCVVGFVVLFFALRLWK